MSYSFVGNSQELKLVPAYIAGADRKSGSNTGDVTLDLLSSWNCMDSIVNMAFDTTASNTVHVIAACITIQEKLGKALIWSACPYHVGEVILSNLKYLPIYR